MSLELCNNLFAKVSQILHELLNVLSKENRPNIPPHSGHNPPTLKSMDNFLATFRLFTLLICTEC